MQVPSQMAWLSCVIFMGIIGLSLQQKSTLRLGVEPRYLRIQDGGTPASMLCTLRDGVGERVPLVGCEVRNHDTIWDLNQGQASPSRNHTVQGVVVHDIYFGTGLNNGECGITLTGLEMRYFYELHCRVKPAVGGAWIYAVMGVDVDGAYVPMQYGLQPSGQVVALPGSDVTLLGSAEHQVESCYFFPPPDFTQIGLGLDITSINTTNYRAWREGKQCGVTLLDVQPSWSNYLRSEVYSYSQNTSSGDFIQLIVASPPLSPPLLTVDFTEEYFRPGDVLNATCVVGESRPVSSLTWFLGREVIKDDNWNEATAETEWKYAYKPRGIEQRLSLQLSLQDDGKELKCRAGHLALPSRSQDSLSHLVRVRVGAEYATTDMQSEERLARLDLVALKACDASSTNKVKSPDDIVTTQIGRSGSREAMRRAGMLNYVSRECRETRLE